MREGGLVPEGGDMEDVESLVLGGGDGSEDVALCFAESPSRRRRVGDLPEESAPGAVRDFVLAVQERDTGLYCRRCVAH